MLVLGVEYSMRYISTKNESEKVIFYSTFFLIHTGPLIAYYHYIEINITFHLIYNTTFYSIWLMSYKGKIRTTPAPVLSILNTAAYGGRMTGWCILVCNFFNTCIKVIPIQ